jgi:hypothetical protein
MRKFVLRWDLIFTQRRTSRPSGMWCNFRRWWVATFRGDLFTEEALFFPEDGGGKILWNNRPICRTTQQHLPEYRNLVQFAFQFPDLFIYQAIKHRFLIEEARIQFQDYPCRVLFVCFDFHLQITILPMIYAWLSPCLQWTIPNYHLSPWHFVLNSDLGLVEYK